MSSIAIKKKCLLKLYVTGETTSSVRAINNLKRLMEEGFKDKYILKIIDVLRYPQLAEDEKIIATPTLIKELPPPLRRLIGDLSEKEKVIMGLDLVKF